MSNGIICTGEGVTLFQLLAAKGAVKLESLGMKHSKIRSVRKVWALEMGLKANAKHDVVIAAIEKRIEEVRANLKPGEVQSI